MRGLFIFTFDTTHFSPSPVWFTKKPRKIARNLLKDILSLVLHLSEYKMPCLTSDSPNKREGNEKSQQAGGESEGVRGVGQAASNSVPGDQALRNVTL